MTRWYCVAGVMLGLSLAARAEELPVATRVEGEVRAQRNQESAELVVQEGTVLRDGDVVRTGADGRVEVTLPTGTVLRIGESGRATISSHRDGHEFGAKLWLGNAWARVQKLLGADAFRIETENGVAGVRGTEFRVEARPGAEDVVRVYEGVVQVGNDREGWVHRLEPGRELRFRRAAKPEGPRPFDPRTEHGDRFMSWVRSHPADEGPARLRELRQHEPQHKEEKRDEREEKREKKKRFHLFR